MIKLGVHLNLVFSYLMSPYILGREAYRIIVSYKFYFFNHCITIYGVMKKKNIKDFYYILYFDITRYIEPIEIYVLSFFTKKKLIKDTNIYTSKNILDKIFKKKFSKISINLLLKIFIIVTTLNILFCVLWEYKKKLKNKNKNS